MSIHNIQGLLGLNLANSGGQPFNFQGLLGGYADPRMAALQGAGQAASRFAGYQPRPVSLGQMIGAMGGAAQQGALGANQQNFANYGQAMNMQMLRQKMQATKAAAKTAAGERAAFGKYAAKYNLPLDMPGKFYIEHAKAQTARDTETFKSKLRGGEPTGRMKEWQGAFDRGETTLTYAEWTDKRTSVGRTIMQLPPGYGFDPKNPGAVIPIPGGPFDPKVVKKRKAAKREEILITNKPARIQELTTNAERLQTLERTISEASDLASSVLTSGITQQVTGWIAGTKAYELEAIMNTIRSIVGFDELLRIKKAGGTLGALSELENRLLQAVQGSLDPNLSEESLVANMKKIEEAYRARIESSYRNYKRDYGEPFSDNRKVKTTPAKKKLPPLRPGFNVIPKS